MNQENGMSSELRLMLGMAVGVLMSTAMSQGVDLVRTPVAVTSSILSILMAVISACLLKKANPRRGKPSRVGNLTLILVLSCFLVIGRLVWINSTDVGIVLYVLSGLISAWLVFTSAAETSLLQAFCIGGFGGGFGAILTTAIVQTPFAPLMDCINISEQSTVNLYIALICTIPSAFTAVMARLSGWGLMGHVKEEVWAFDKEGRRYTKLTTR